MNNFFFLEIYTLTSRHASSLTFNYNVILVLNFVLNFLFIRKCQKCVSVLVGYWEDMV